MQRPRSIAPTILKNRFIHLEVLEGAGPRISALVPAGSNQNLLAELPEAQWETPYGQYHLFGGHRLWSAPEVPAMTYFPEDIGCTLELLPGGMRLSRQDRGAVHYERSFEVQLESDSPRVHIKHTLRNLGSSPLTAAPWAITVLPMGSRVLVPLEQKIVDDNPFLPNRNLVLWQYSDPADPRFKLANASIHLSSDPAQGPFKFGVYSTRGWAAAQIGEWLLVKRFTPLPADARLDQGANLEVYTNQFFVELETLGELRTLMTGESVQHDETWDVISGKLEDLDENGMIPSNTEGRP